MNTDKDRLLPEMMGIEHEISVKFNARAKVDINLLSEDFRFTKTNEDYFISRLYNYPYFSDDQLWGDDYNLVTTNGSLFKYTPGFPLEIATPECPNPKELVKYRTAARLLIQKWSEQLLLDQSNELRSLSLHERVIDTEGNTWGEHDNYSLDESNYEWGNSEGSTPHLLWLHLLTRGCVTGAGRISRDDSLWQLSQKLPTVELIRGKKWGSTGYYSDFDRFEVRCSDKNISEWAQLVRIGSFAIVMALAKDGLGLRDLSVEDDVLDESKIGQSDMLIVNKNGEIKFSKEAVKAVTIQKKLAALAVEYTSEKCINQDYRRIAKDWYSFTNQLEKEAEYKDYIDLTHFLKADWAAKFYLVQNRLKKDRANMLNRSPFDFEAMSQDLTYDLTYMDAPLANNKVYVAEGYGFKLNDKIPERKVLNRNDVLLAINKVPSGGRAERRASALNELLKKNVEISSYHWNCITWKDSHDIDNRLTFN